MSFPTLKTDPYDCSTDREDNSIKSKSEAGYVQARPRFTRSRKTFDVKIRVDDDDYALLEAYDGVVMSSGIFAWTHPVSGTTYQVRYSKRIKETPINLGGSWLHEVEFTLEEA